MYPESRTLSRDEVVTSERRAWTQEDRGNGRVYSFDGINFWCQSGRSDAQLAAPRRTPRDGWRHRDACRCERGTS